MRGRGAQYRDCERDTGLALLLSLSIDLRSSVGFFAITGFLFANNSCFEAAFFSSKTPELIKRRIIFNLQVVIQVPHTWHCSSSSAAVPNEVEVLKKIILRRKPPLILLTVVLFLLSCWKEVPPLDPPYVVCTLGWETGVQKVLWLGMFLDNL